jgi:glycosyltransferase involved in cell wall biosynthesis
MPKISVITATYNMARYLPETIDSVLSQDHPDFEYIILDDGSTDATPDVVRSFGDRVQYHYQPNAGVAIACSNVASFARGEYLHLLDADDVLQPGALSREAAVLDQHPTAALAYSGSIVIDARGRVTGKRSSPHRAGLVPSRVAFNQLLRGCHITNSTVMVRRSLYESMPWFQAEAVPGEDWDLWLRITANHDIAYTGEILASYRIHNTSITSGYTVENVITSHFRTIGRLFATPGFRYSHLRPYAYACLERTVARVAARLRRRREFASHLARAIRHSPTVLLEHGTLTVAAEGAKTLIPQPVIAAGRHIRRAVRTGGNAT